MSKTMGVSPVTGTIYYGTAKNNMRQVERKDVTDMEIKAGLCTKWKKNALTAPFRYDFHPYVL